MKVLLFLLYACDGGAKIDDTGSQETGNQETGNPECNTENEECASGVSGCGGEGANMLPGSDCLACHAGGRDERVSEEAPTWSAGGTLFADLEGSAGVSGATVRITDSTGDTLELTTSSKGNFYTARSLTPPLTVEVETSDGVVSMGRSVETGACNSCHACEGEAGGKMYAP